MSLDLATLLYLVASVCFIQALKGLSHPTTSIRGNLFGMAGMAIAVLTTAALIVRFFGTYGTSPVPGLGWVLLGVVVGGGYGAWRAKTVEMTQMPELVAFFHSMIGMAAVFIAVAADHQAEKDPAEADRGRDLVRIEQPEDQRPGRQHGDRHAGHAEDVAPDRGRRVAEALQRLDEADAVSYTHLTLPTN